MEVIDRAAFDGLLEALRRRDYELVGPTIEQSAIVHGEIRSSEDLPVGWTEDQEGGTYRLHRRDDKALFGYAVGPQSWKQYLQPARVRLWRARRDEDGGIDFEQDEGAGEQPRYAFIGARSCDLHAIAVQDRVLASNEYSDPIYKQRRDAIFVVAINCGQAGGTCFCVSMDTGPKASFGFDLALTELLDGEHRFLVEVGTDRGAEVLAEVPSREAGEGDVQEGTAATQRATEQQGREMETEGIKELLYRNMEHPRWDEVSERCLTCGNCTMVCPTCFCTTVEDTTDLEGETAERWRNWDSCFTMDHSHLHEGSVRSSARSRYRQWMTHKLATWIDQFGTSGCTGCGRCITWCPVAIDITEEAAVIRATDGARREEGGSSGDS
jgi:ferredoxin